LCARNERPFSFSFDIDMSGRNMDNGVDARSGSLQQDGAAPSEGARRIVIILIIGLLGYLL
jgi:hypothetical protein